MTPGPEGLHPERRQALEQLAQRLGHRFQDLRLLDQALRHSSYAHENPESGPSNERLEFLGDAVLALTVSNLLLARFPGGSEGELSRGRAALVNAGWLGALARDLDLADALEAVLAAVYLDGGLEAAARLTSRWFKPALESGLPWQDFKTALQEYTQSRFKASPAYHLVAESGPGHARHFLMEVRLQETPLAQGEGRTKKQAAQQAAARALEILQGQDPSGKDDAPSP
jgi:ribonuclease-3